MKFFNKNCTGLMTGAVLLASLVQGPSSNAAVGVALQNLDVVYTGLGIGIGVPFAVIPFFLMAGGCSEDFGGEKCGDAVEKSMPWLFVTGLLILDDSSDGVLAFQPMTESQAEKMGISANELSAFNEEIPELNAISASITNTISNLPKNDSAVLTASQLWTESEVSLSPDAASAFQKFRMSVAKSAP